MKKFLASLVLITAVCMSILPVNTFARGRPAPRPTAAVDTHDRITALSLTSVIVTVAATHQSKEYKVTAATKITANGKACTLHDLAVGMDVAVTALPNDPTTAATIDGKTAAKK